MKKIILLFIGFFMVTGDAIAMYHVIDDPLTVAIKQHNLSAVNALLQSKKFDVNKPLDSKDMTYLHIAAVRGTPAIVATLTAHGADANTQTSAGVTPLHMAAFKGHADIALILIVAGGARVDQQTNVGATPLHIAACKWQIPVFNVLIQAKANPDIRDKHGVTPMDLLKRLTKEPTKLESEAF